MTAADNVPWAKSFFSRYCVRRALYPSPAAGVGAFVERLCGIVDEVRPELLMPMTERTILAIMAYRKRIESCVAIAPLPSEHAFAVALDKGTTVELAESRGLPVPRTFRLSHLEDLSHIRSQLPYPVVIKPRRSQIWTVDDQIVSSGPVEYCFAPQELERKYLAVHRRAPLPLIQEFIPGEGYGISTLYCRGQLRALFAHRRLRMVHPTGSGSSLRESIAPPPDMVEAARSLLDALAWHGVAMVEFKRDPRDGLPKLMEINGRFWNSLPLAVAAGVDFPLLLYRLAMDGEVPECFAYRLGVKSRWLTGDLRHLAEVMRGRPRGWAHEFPSRWGTLRDVLRTSGGDVRYDELWPSDRLPLIGDVADLFLHQLPQFFRHQPGAAVQERPQPELAANQK